MKAFIITPDTRTIEEVDIGGHDDIAALIGFDTVASDEVGPDGDRLYFDEECFLRGSSGRFQIDQVVPVSGTGVVAGSADDGASLRDAVSSIEALRDRVSYL
jgi:hypothetical protein